MTKQLQTIESQAEVPAVADPMTSLIERVVMDPNLPLERVEAALQWRERQMEKEAEQIFNAAFAAAMAEMPDVPRSGENKHLQRKYSTLDDLIRTARPVLSRHGLSLNWSSSGDEGNLVGRDPRKVSAEEFAAHFREFPTGLRLIRAKCLDCAHSAVEVRKCVCTTCPLWPYRMGSKPKGIREIKGENMGPRPGGKDT